MPRLRSFSGNRPVVAFALAVVAARVSFARAPFLGDDLWQLAALEGQSPPANAFRGRLDLFRYFSGNPADVAAAMDRGARPWWLDGEMKMAFLRPLASALASLDHALAGCRPLLPHLHSLLWLALVIVAAGRLFRRTLPPAAAWIALASFALGPSLLAPTMWWCNRHALVAATFGIFAIDGYLAAREAPAAGRRRWAWPLTAFALALAAGESAIAVLPYLLACELTAHAGTSSGPSDRRAGLRRLAPFVGLTLVYLIAWSALGYGTRRIEAIYVDPFATPSLWMKTVASSFPGAILELTTHARFVAVSAATLGQGAAGVSSFATAFGVALLVGVVAFAARRMRAPGPAGRILGGFVLGAVLGLPASLSKVDNDSLVLASLGFAAAIGLVAARAWTLAVDRGIASVQRLAALAVGMLLVFTHAVATLPAAEVMTRLVAANSLAGSSLNPIGDLPLTRGVRRAVTLQIDGATRLPSLWNLPELPPFADDLVAAWTLSTAELGCDVRRVDATTLVLEARGEGGLLRPDMHRFASAPLRGGQRIALRGLTIDVESVNDEGDVTRARFSFDRDLDDPTFAFFVGRAGKLQRVTLPPPGQALVLAQGEASVAP